MILRSEGWHTLALPKRFRSEGLYVADGRIRPSAVPPTAHPLVSPGKLTNASSHVEERRFQRRVKLQNQSGLSASRLKFGPLIVHATCYVH